MLLTALRCLAIVVLVGALYYLAPFATHESVAATVVRLIAGLLVLSGLLVWQIGRIRRADLPALQAVEALILALFLFLTLFATIYGELSQYTPGAFNTHMDRNTALYFTITTFGTVGFGDVAPVLGGARMLVSLQILIDLVFVGLVVKVLAQASQSVFTHPGGDVAPELPTNGTQAAASSTAPEVPRSDEAPDAPSQPASTD